MNRRAQHAHGIMQRRYLLFAFSAIVCAVTYFINPVPFNYLLVAAVCGAIALPAFVLQWGTRSEILAGVLFACILFFLMIVPNQVSQTVFNARGEGVSFWLRSLSYLSVFFSMFFAMLIFFRTAIITFLKAEPSASLDRVVSGAKAEDGQSSSGIRGK